jgi:nucleotide-binding universal stress UspA family protein
MITINKILCPVDFFPASDAAANHAIGLGANYDARIHLLHVITPLLPTAYEYAIDTVEIMKSLEKNAADEMNVIVGRAKDAGVHADTEIRIGDVRRGVERWFMGSTTEKLLRHSPVPMLTISGSGDKALTAPRFRRILVTTDFSEGTADALAYAFSVAQENDSRITLLHVVHDVAADVSGKYRESLIKGVDKQLIDLVPPEARNWCDVDTRVETGVPYRIIFRTLEDEKIDLLVMNIHGKGMLDRALLGSTAERVVRASSCPVMLIPPMKRKLKRRARPGGRAAA